MVEKDSSVHEAFLSILAYFGPLYSRGDRVAASMSREIIRMRDREVVGIAGGCAEMEREADSQSDYSESHITVSHLQLHV